MNRKNDYSDIIDLPHHVSKTHPPMSMRDRAAQFSPFAALTGFDDAVRETARLTGQRIELDEDEKQRISNQLLLLRAHLSETPEVTITRFLPDEQKEGGEYITVTGSVKRLDELRQSIIMTDGTEIPIEDITAIDSPLCKESGDDRIGGYAQHIPFSNSYLTPSYSSLPAPSVTTKNR